jgi:hypothetical protein
MADRLYQYVFLDDKARHNGDRLSLSIAFAASVVAFFTFKASLQFALGAGVIVLLLSMTSATLWYCLQPQKSALQVAAATTQAKPPRRGLFYPIALATGAILFAVFSRFELEAAVLNQRLKRASKTPTAKSLNEAVDVLSVANRDRVRLNPAAIQKIVDHRLTLSDVENAVQTRIDSEAAKRGVKTPILGLKIWTSEKIGQVFITGVPGEVSLRSVGLSPEQFGTHLVPPDMVADLGPISSRNTDPSRPGTGYIFVAGSDQHITIPLDGMTGKNVIFSNCKLIYTGKAIELENTSFYHCNLDFSENITCQRLAEVLLKCPAVTFNQS